MLALQSLVTMANALCIFSSMEVIHHLILLLSVAGHYQDIGYSFDPIARMCLIAFKPIYIIFSYTVSYFMLHYIGQESTQMKYTVLNYVNICKTFPCISLFHATPSNHKLHNHFPFQHTGHYCSRKAVFL